jgi:hypothetical protein
MSVLTLSQGMMKRGDVVMFADDDDDDDEVRTSGSKNRATSTLCTWVFFLRTKAGQQ